MSAKTPEAGSNNKKLLRNTDLTVPGISRYKEYSMNKTDQHTCPHTMGETKNKQISKNTEFVNGNKYCVEK